MVGFPGRECEGAYLLTQLGGRSPPPLPRPAQWGCSSGAVPTLQALHCSPKVIIGPKKRSRGSGTGSPGARVASEPRKGFSVPLSLSLCLPWPSSLAEPPSQLES